MNVKKKPRATVQDATPALDSYETVRAIIAFKIYANPETPIGIRKKGHRDNDQHRI